MTGRWIPRTFVLSGMASVALLAAAVVVGCASGNGAQNQPDRSSGGASMPKAFLDKTQIDGDKPEGVGFSCKYFAPTQRTAYVGEAAFGKIRSNSDSGEKMHEYLTRPQFERVMHGLFMAAEWYRRVEDYKEDNETGDMNHGEIVVQVQRARMARAESVEAFIQTRFGEELEMKRAARKAGNDLKSYDRRPVDEVGLSDKEKSFHRQKTLEHIEAMKKQFPGLFPDAEGPLT